MALMFVVMAISMWANKKFYVDMFKEIEKDKVALFFASIIEMTAGAAVVLNHNLWGTVPEIIITIIGWGAILEGLTALFWTKKYKKLALRVFSEDVFAFSAGFIAALGLYLGWIGLMG